MVEWWDSINYQWDEIFGKFKYFFNSTGYHDPVITERSGLTGKCFSLQVPDPVLPKQGLMVYLRFHALLSAKQEIVLYVHEPQNILGKSELHASAAS